MSKSFQNIAAQGDVLFRRIAAIPASATRVDPVNGRLVITHSETGHDHVMVLDRPKAKVPAVEMYAGDNPLVAWIKSQPADPPGTSTPPRHA